MNLMNLSLQVKNLPVDTSLGVPTPQWGKDEALCEKEQAFWQLVPVLPLHAVLLVGEEHIPVRDMRLHEENVKG